jgi:hypothetical protein
MRGGLQSVIVDMLSSRRHSFSAVLFRGYPVACDVVTALSSHVWGARGRECAGMQVAGEESSEEEAPAAAPEPAGTEEEVKERKLLADIDAAVQKEAARQRRLKKTVRSAACCGADTPCPVAVAGAVPAC